MLKGKVKKFLGESLKKVARNLLLPPEVKGEDGKLDMRKVEVVQRRYGKEAALEQWDKRWWAKAKASGWSSEYWEERKWGLSYNTLGDPRWLKECITDYLKIIDRFTPTPEQEFDEDMKKEGGTPAKIRQKKKW